MFTKIIMGALFVWFCLVIIDRTLSLVLRYYYRKREKKKAKLDDAKSKLWGATKEKETAQKEFEKWQQKNNLKNK